MKVLQICSNFSIDYHGGITKYVKSLAIALKEKNVNLAIVSGGSNDKIDNIEFYHYIANKVRAYSIGTEYNDQPIDKLLEYIKNNNYNIVHIHATGDFPLKFYDTLHKLNIRYIVSLHDYYFICPRVFMIDKNEEICHYINPDKCSTCVGKFESNDFLFRTSRKLRKKFNIKLPDLKSNVSLNRLNLMKNFLSNAELLLPVSAKVRDIFMDICPEGNFEILHIGNDTANHQFVAHIKSTKVRLTFMGALNKHKGQDVLEYIAKNLSNKFEINYYGGASGDDMDHLKQYGVKFHGRYAPQDLEKIMKTTDIGLVLPIWEDNAPQVVMEFLNLGRLVVGTKRGGIPDFVKHLENGYLFDPENEVEKKELISWLESLSSGQIDLMQRNIHKLKTPTEHANEIYKIYERVLK